MDDRVPERDLSKPAVPRRGRLVETGDRHEPHRLVDADRTAVAPSTWTLDQWRTFIHDARGQQLETARVAAQGQAYSSSHPREARRQWAKLSLLANRRMLDNAEGPSARLVQHDFMLRTWVIDRLGPDGTDPQWSPEALASDTLDALTFTPAQAAGLAECWRDLPLGQIRELRWHKNLTAHLDILVGYLAHGPVREQLATWNATRPLLP